jgi:hypothetical protein
MEKRWELLHEMVMSALDPLWHDFAKQGRAAGVFVPMAKYPHASAWLAENLSLSDDSITRKLGAMLGGWVEHPAHAHLLFSMLDRERKVFAKDRIVANSVGEDKK